MKKHKEDSAPDKQEETPATDSEGDPAQDEHSETPTTEQEGSLAQDGREEIPATERKGDPVKDAGSAIIDIKKSIVLKAITDAAEKYGDAYTDEELAKMGPQKRVSGHGTGILPNQDKFELVGHGTKGLGQTVVYRNRFVEKPSEITDDMNIAGAISIKTNMIEGFDRDAYIDINKSEQSDLNFYISVKVINQSVNFKDALK